MSHDNFATRVLETDVRKHGRRFVLVEFVAATMLCVVLAAVIALAAIVRGSGEAIATVGVVFFVGVAVNAYSVTRWVATHGPDFAEQRVSLRDAAAFAVATLLPGVLRVALRRRA